MCNKLKRQRLTSHIQLGFPGERPDDKIPIRQVLRVVDLNSWIPFEGGCGDVVVFADPQDRRVGVEAWEDGVSDLGHGGLLDRFDVEFDVENVPQRLAYKAAYQIRASFCTR